MKLITFTRKKVKRIVAVTSMAAVAVAVGAVAVLTSVGTQAAERKLPIYSVERGDNKIALTFDVAWENSNTAELIEILDEFDAKATFFVTGDWCDRYPEDVMMFYEAGHEIQNHSDQHPHVEGINVNELISDTKACSQKIKMLTGEEPKLYRAPYGEYDDSLITTIEGMGMKPIQWDVEAIDIDGKALRELHRKHCSRQKRPPLWEVLRPSKKSRWDFPAVASALRALAGGIAANSHTGADRSVF